MLILNGRLNLPLPCHLFQSLGQLYFNLKDIMQSLHTHTEFCRPLIFNSYNKKFWIPELQERFLINIKHTFHSCLATFRITTEKRPEGYQKQEGLKGHCIKRLAAAMPTLSMLLQLYFPLKDNTACRDAFLQGLGLHAQLCWPLICNSFKTKTNFSRD